MLKSSSSVFHAEWLAWEKECSPTFYTAMAVRDPMSNVVWNVTSRHQWARQCSSDMLDTSHGRQSAWRSTVWTGRASILIAGATVADMVCSARKSSKPLNSVLVVEVLQSPLTDRPMLHCGSPVLRWPLRSPAKLLPRGLHAVGFGRGVGGDISKWLPLWSCDVSWTVHWWEWTAESWMRCIGLNHLSWLSWLG